MEKALFSTTCLTCGARLAVRNADAIGAILACPKCGSMVEIAPPEDWEPDAEPKQEAAPVATAATAAAAASTESQPPQASPVQKTPNNQAEPATAGLQESPTADGMADSELAGPPSPLAYASATEMAWRKWLLFSATAVGVLVVVAGAWSLFFSFADTPPPEKIEARELGKKTESKRPQASDKVAPKPLETEGVVRWLPDETLLAFDFRPWRLAEYPRSKRLIDHFGFAWGETVYPLLRGFNISLEKIERVSWACTDLSAWPRKSMAVIYLRKGQDARQLESLGKTAGFSVDGHTCRLLPDGQWKQPFTVIDKHTIITGDGELLRRLSGRKAPKFKSATIKRLFEAVEPGTDFTLMVDLAAARAANWRIPNSLMDTWSQGKQPWRVAWDMPEGLGLSLLAADRTTATLTLLCETETVAQQVRAAVDKLVATGGKLAVAQMDTLVKFLQAGKLTVAVAHQYRFVLEKVLAASKDAKAMTADTMVSLCVDFGEGCSALPAALVDSREAIRGDWLAAALAVDHQNHQRLATGLSGYRKAEGHFPEGAVGGASLPPETRLSWIATMLPYYGHPDWHRELQFPYRWNGSQNRPVTQRLLPEVINPALGPASTAAGFPVTHYVGAGGVGADAARLSASDPRAGVFGLGRVTRSTEISDGASNTIAVLGVTGGVGAWAAGGDPTVRALVNKPYVNGPDGFGSGQPDGMLVGMADGSVRFISEEVDSLLVEQFVTIAGSEEVNVALLDPKLVDPPPVSRQPEQPPSEPPEDEIAEDEIFDPGIPPEDEPEAEIERPPLATVNVAARLADPIVQLDLEKMPLVDAITLLSDMSTVPVTIDPEALHQLGVGLRDPVTVKLEETTVGEAFRAVLSAKKLAYVEQDGQLLVTGSQSHREQLREKSYGVGDLTGSDAKSTAGFAALVQQMVSPDSWRNKGGRGSIEIDDGKLLVSQTAPVHYRLLVFCEKLRLARGKAPRSRLDPRRYAVKSRAVQAGKVLGQPVAANFQDTAPLKEVLGYLGGLANVDILVDRLALARAGLSADMPASLAVDGQPLLVALGQLLGPSGLSCRVVDAETLQVTTRKALAQRGEIEFYRVDELLGGLSATQSDPNAEKLIERIKSGVAGSSWSDAGGPGQIYFDRRSRCLIVLQSQPVQTAVQSMIVKLKSAGK